MINVTFFWSSVAQTRVCGLAHMLNVRRVGLHVSGLGVDFSTDNDIERLVQPITKDPQNADLNQGDEPEVQNHASSAACCFEI